MRGPGGREAESWADRRTCTERAHRGQVDHISCLTSAHNLQNKTCLKNFYIVFYIIYIFILYNIYNFYIFFLYIFPVLSNIIRKTNNTAIPTLFGFPNTESD